MRFRNTKPYNDAKPGPLPRGRAPGAPAGFGPGLASAGSPLQTQAFLEVATRPPEPRPDWTKPQRIRH